MDREWAARDAVALIAVVGLIVSAVATLAAHLWTVGELPNALVPYRALLATFRASHGVPLEFALVAGFGLLLVTLAAQGDRSEIRFASLMVSTVLLGVAVGLLAINPRAVTMWLVTTTAAAGFASTQAGDGRRIREMAGAVRDLSRTPRARVALVIWALGAVVLAQVMSSRAAAISRVQAETKQLAAYFSGATPVPERMLWPDTGRHRLVVFSDYQCAACRAMVPQLRSIVSGAQLRGAAIDIEIHDFPLAAACNTAAMSTPHRLACEMAVAARLVSGLRPRDSATFESWLFRQTDHFSHADLERELESLNLADAYRERFPEVLAEVAADAARGAKVGVFQTPTVFLDGVRLPAITPKGVEELLDSIVAGRLSPGR